MRSIFQYFKEIFKALSTLWAGMRITGKYFLSPRQVVTEQYPENRSTLKMTDKFKGEVVMPHDENNMHLCTGCGICEVNCPNGSIEIIIKKEPDENGKPKRMLDKHVYYLSMCTFCGLCIKTCPSDAIVWGGEFEHAVFDRKKLTKVLNKPGSSLKPKKKEVAS